MTKDLIFTIKGYSMYPNYTPGETIIFNEMSENQFNLLEVNDLILFLHPFKGDTKVFKRIKSLSHNMIFVTGDNPDPTSSFDSHNFGPIHKTDVLGYKKEHV